MTHDSATKATIELAYDAMDFDANVTTFSVTVASAELTDGGGLTSNTVTISATVETATISADQAMAEDTLDARSLTLTLSGTTFANATLATGNFTLNNAPTGTSVESVAFASSTQALIALAFDGTDFDANISTFSVTIAAVEMSDGVAITSNALSIIALAESATIVADQAMTEANLDARSLTLTLGGGAVFADTTLASGSFTLNNAPTGTTIQSVTHNSSSQATIALAFDNTDFDTDVTTFSVTVAAAELNVGAAVTSNQLTITALNEVATIVADQAMTEENLDARSLTLTLSGGVTFDDATLVAGNFTLNNAPTGATVESVTHDSSTQATIPLAFTGADFDTSITDFTLTVAAVELSVVSDATSNRLSITATSETATIVADQAMTESNLNARSLTLTLSGATFADSTSDSANFAFNNAPAGTTIEGVSFVSSTQSMIALAFNGTDFDSNLTFSVTLAAAELTDGGGLDSNSLIITATVEAPAPTPPTPTTADVVIEPLTGGFVSTADSVVALPAGLRGPSPESVLITGLQVAEIAPSFDLDAPLPSGAASFLAQTDGGQPIAGIDIVLTDANGVPVTGALSRTVNARVCFPLSRLPPGVNVSTDMIVPGAIVTDGAILGADVCVDFVFDHVSTFFVGAKTKAVVPELADFYDQTGGATVWGPCLTNGFFVGVGEDGKLHEVPTSAAGGLYIQVCANGALGFIAGLTGAGPAVQPVLVSQWLRSRGGPLNGIDPAAPPSGDGQYFFATGHNVSGQILAEFNRLGGVSVVGFPLTEPFVEIEGFTSHYSNG